MKRNKYLSGVMAAVALLTVASCTDFDDYNTAFEGSADEQGVKATQTLWANISSQQDLSQFSEVLKQTEFDKLLDGSRFYTVWAPVNGTFNYDSLMALDSMEIVDRFISNHVANFNFPVTEPVFNQRIHMLNNKSYDFAGTSEGLTFDGLKIDQANIPGLNGVMHTLSGGAVRFLPSLYEYVLDTVQAKTSGFENISKYLFTKEERTPDYSKSIEGPIDEYGNQTYSYIVYNVVNDLVGKPSGRGSNKVRARWDIEDSTFTVIVPNDKAYNDALKRIKSCCKYVESMNYWSFPEKTDVPATSEKVSVEVADMDTTYAFTYLFANSTFNNHHWRNRWLVDPNDVYKEKTNDTIVTTNNYYLSNATELLNDHLVDRIRMSNGWVHIVDTLAYRPWEYWNPELHVNLYSSTYRARVLSATPERRTIAYDELDTEKGTDIYNYLELKTSGDASNPDAYFYISGVLSTTYNVYVVTVPANIKKGSTEKARSYKFKASMNFADANGAVKAVGSPSKDFGTFTSDSTKVDTIALGQVTFPVAYKGTKAMPFIEIKGQRSTWNKKEWDTIDNTLRITGIYLIPEDYDAYLKKQKEANNLNQTEE